MFSFFRKKNQLRAEDFAFLNAIVKNLPSKYDYLVDQVSDEFILDKKINKLGDEGTYTLTLNANLEKKFANKSFPQFFIIRDVQMWNALKKAYDFVELHILEGMLAGFKAEADYKDLDFNRVNVSQVKEKHFKNEDVNKVKKIIGKVDAAILSQLEIESSFKIELPEGVFYTIKDFGNGDYLTMNSQGAVFGLIHDPFEIERIFVSKAEFFQQLKDNSFDVDEYYANKMS